jgi:dynein heavy chain
MAAAHEAVGGAAAAYLASCRRYCYTTPKSYLELIALYKQLLGRRRSEVGGAKARLRSGVEKIGLASAQVADLQAALRQEQAVVEEKKVRRVVVCLVFLCVSLALYDWPYIT